MTVRVGIDLVDVDDIRQALAAHGQRYLERVFTPGEIADCGGPSAPRPDRLAARFAAKEAAFKALRCSDVLVFQEIEVVTDARGAPTLALHGRTAALAATGRRVELDVSLTHERDLAAAVVAITTLEPEGAPA